MKDHSPKLPIFYGVPQPIIESRSEKLARLPRELEQGTYQVDSEKLANTL